MNYEIRPAIKADEPLLWQMLYYASRMERTACRPSQPR
jgi:hypothetical protein